MSASNLIQFYSIFSNKIHQMFKSNTNNKLFKMYSVAKKDPKVQYK